jgi:pimeloyl-ACP methyl ester carboxylesterase
MFRNLIPALADEFHLVAPDYPGFGNSSAPPVEKFEYPRWHDYFRTHQPPTLIVWGQNDTIFPPAGAEPYKKDLKNIEFHLLDTGHFALEEDGGLIADLMRRFLRKHAATK